MIVVALIGAISFYSLEEQMAQQVRESQQNVPGLTR